MFPRGGARMGGEDRDSEGAAVDDGGLALWVDSRLRACPGKRGRRGNNVVRFKTRRVRCKIKLVGGL